MIPIRLNLRNFMCYTTVHEPLVFDGIRVACLSGQNGHGKSALLDAMTWALWGKSRARSVDDLVHIGPGSTEMEVELEFRLGDDQYRVLRKRDKRRKQSALELNVLDRESGAYRPLTGNNLAETERQIAELLKMSYDTFVNSSFILQGRADSFTTRTPAERKQVLAEILDLSYYDKLEDRARKKERECAERQGTLQQQIRDDDEELKQQPDLRQRQAKLETELSELADRLTLGETRGELLRLRLTTLQAAERELQEQTRRLSDYRARADRQRTLAAAAEAAIERAEAVIAREAEIEVGFKALQDRRAELDGLTMLQTEHNRLAFERSCQEKIIMQERGRLEGRLKQLEAQLRGGSAEAARLEEYQRALAAAHQEQDELARLDQERDGLNELRQSAREQYAALNAQLQGCQGQLEEARERHRLLGDSPTCPVCRTSLGSDHHRDLLRQFRREEEMLAAKATQTEQQRQKVFKEGTALKEQLAELERRLAERGESQKRLALAERAVARAEEQARGLATQQAELEQLQTALSQNNYAAEARQELVSLERQIMTLAYNVDSHARLRETVQSLTQFEALRQDLSEARRSLAREQEARLQAQVELADWEAQAAEAERRRAELLFETAELPTAQAESAAADAELRGLRAQHGQLRQELGAVLQHLATMEYTAQRRDERRAELENVLKDRSLYQELVQAFGKKGLQAMLIETAIPEIQDEANRLLSLMSDGRMSVTLSTQREARSGDGTIETLDINIQDELGQRPYEMYSGGEAFRINFAIRIALSKLLAHRAGAKLQTLVIDEGFGSQDEQGLDRLVEAIRVIQDEFEKILIVTHLTDLKDAFDTRIEVTKTPHGSVFEVA
jgi:DNA repair protein SbcC/Rad50